jgi:nucleotide-binding universal stress UspA family protein
LTVVVRWFAAVSLEVPISSDERWRAMADRSGSESHIVVGVDGSVGSIEALKWAARWAEHTGDAIQAVHAWMEPSAFGAVYLPTDWQPEDDARAVLDEAIRAAFGDAPSAGLVATTLEGPAATILEAASQGAQLLVVGSRGHGEIVGALLGSVSLHCTAHARCPVVVVRPRRPVPSQERRLASASAGLSRPPI